MLCPNSVMIACPKTRASAARSCPSALRRLPTSLSPRRWIGGRERPALPTSRCTTRSWWSSRPVKRAPHPSAAPPRTTASRFTTSTMPPLSSRRERLAAELVAFLREHYFLTVVGASSSGKSSLIRAGVVPAFRAGQKLKGGILPPLGSTA
jgi:hypothetical protein